MSQKSTINIRFTAKGEEDSVRDFFSELEAFLKEQLTVDVERMSMDYVIEAKKDWQWKIHPVQLSQTSADIAEQISLRFTEKELVLNVIQ